MLGEEVGICFGTLGVFGVCDIFSVINHAISGFGGR